MKIRHHGRLDGSLAACLAAALLTLAPACQPVEPQGASFMRQPLREVKTERDRQYVWCIGHDPFFTTPECKQLQGGR
ncbi:hypothetical protein KHP62_20420 [Rhodobacteraceae bacterium NNCM2]|nr:hypothetical protein [Coraliihabitans acroporae]